MEDANSERRALIIAQGHELRIFFKSIIYRRLVFLSIWLLLLHKLYTYLGKKQHCL